MKIKLGLVIDIVVFQTAWFACVFSSLSSFPLLLPLIGLLTVSIRSIYMRGVFVLLPFVFSSLLMGLVGDALLVKMGFIAFTDYPSVLGVPYWMLILWLNFGLMLRPLFEWFLEHFWRALVGFSIGGEIAYFSGHKLEVLTFTKGWQSTLAVGVEWAIAGIAFHYLHLQFCTKMRQSHYEYN